MAKIIEFVGSPGSGKSLATAILVRQLNDAGSSAVDAMACIGPKATKARRVWRKSSLALGEVCRSPLATAAMLRAVSNSQQPGLRERASLISKLLTLRSLVRAGRRSETITIFDQGPLMVLWSAALSGSPMPCMDLLTSRRWAWITPDLVVSVSADHDFVIDQLARRRVRQSRLELLDESAQRSAMAEMSTSLAAIERWWQQRDGGVGDVVKISNPGTEEFVKCVADFAHVLRDTINERVGCQQSAAASDGRA